MLVIYTELDTIDLSKIIDVPADSYFEDEGVTSMLDESDNEIVRSIDGSELLNTSTIFGKFSKCPIEIGKLSDGCKVLLCINHAIKKKLNSKLIFDITDCGKNAIEYLATRMAVQNDVNVYCRHEDWGEATGCIIKLPCVEKTFDSLDKAIDAISDYEYKLFGDDVDEND